MKNDIKKLLIQVVSVLLFSIIVFYFLPPKGGGSNEGEIFCRFIIRHLLICMIGFLISDVIIFTRRPMLVASMASLVAGFVGAIIGGILGVLFAALIYSLIGTSSPRFEKIGLFVVPIICIVFSYNFVYKRVRW